MGGAEDFAGSCVKPFRSSDTTAVPYGLCDAYVDECPEFETQSDMLENYGGVNGDKITAVEAEVSRRCTYVEGCWLKSNAFSSVLAEMKPKEAPNA